MSEKSALVESFFENDQDYNTIVNTTTLGLDNVWKEEMYSLIPHNIKLNNILDLASGTGIISFKLAQMYPNAQITGMDITRSFLKRSESELAQNRLKNVRFIFGDAETPANYLKKNYKADLVISSYLPKYVNPEIFIENIQSILHSESVLIFQDFIYPHNSIFQLGYNIYWLFLDPYLVANPQTNQYGQNKLYNLIKTTTWVSDFKKEFIKYDWKVKFHNQLDISAILVISKQNG